MRARTVCGGEFVILKGWDILVAMELGQERRRAYAKLHTSAVKYPIQLTQIIKPAIIFSIANSNQPQPRASLPG